MNSSDLDGFLQVSSIFRLDNRLLLLLSLLGLVLIVKVLEKLGEAIYKKVLLRRMLISQVVTVAIGLSLKELVSSVIALFRRGIESRLGVSMARSAVSASVRCGW